MPPSAAKWGVWAGCQSCVYATAAPAARARSISALTSGTISAPPLTEQAAGGIREVVLDVHDDERHVGAVAGIRDRPPSTTPDLLIVEPPFMRGAPPWIVA